MENYTRKVINAVKRAKNAGRRDLTKTLSNLAEYADPAENRWTKIAVHDDVRSARPFNIFVV